MTDSINIPIIMSKESYKQLNHPFLPRSKGHYPYHHYDHPHYQRGRWYPYNYGYGYSYGPSECECMWYETVESCLRKKNMYNC
jgi:hypothetical protein